MRAFQLRSYDGPAALALVEAAEPIPQGPTAVVDVHAIGINFPDLLLTQGLYQLRPELPCVPGCEIAGVIRSTPDGSAWKVGDRVAGFIWEGGYAEVAAAPVDHLVALPDNMDFTSAAALLVNHHTTHFALAQRGRLQPGETLLVLGAAGGIGSAAVQVGKGLGARVIAGVASRSQFPVAEAAGADSVVVLGEGFSVPVRELTAQRGVDAVLDPLGDWLLQESMRCLAPEGRALIVGFAAGGIPTIKVNRLLLNNIAAVGVAWGARLAQDPDLLRNGAAALHEMFARGVVHPQISARYDFADLPHALTELQHGNISGKAVVDLRR